MRIEKLKYDDSLCSTWQARELCSTDTMLKAQANFSGKPGMMGRVMVEIGDRFVETYYSDRWYNVFEISDPFGSQPKVMYFNIAKPASIEVDLLRWVDMELDVLVYPNGEADLLDIDEFGILDLDFETQRMCWQAVQQIIAWSKSLKPSSEGFLLSI